MKRFKSLLNKSEQEVHIKRFMEPETIDDSEWGKDTKEVPFKRKLVKLFGKKSTRFV